MFVVVFLAYLSSAVTQHGNLHPAGDLFYSAGLHRKKIGRGFGKNAGEWTGSVEIKQMTKKQTGIKVKLENPAAAVPSSFPYF